MSTAEERVRKIVIEQLGATEEQATNEASFVDDLGADSLDTVELVMALEEEFECEIPDEEAENITTIQQAIDYVNAHSSLIALFRQPCVCKVAVLTCYNFIIMTHRHDWS